MKWADKYLSPERAESLLTAVETHPDAFRSAPRAHATIFCGYNLGLRITEICLLRRHHFKSLQQGFASLPTLKRSQKIRFQCPNCGKRFNLAARRGGKKWPCPDCYTFTDLPVFEISQKPKDIEIPFVEPTTAAYIEAWMEGMRPEQDLLFERKPGVACDRRDLWFDFKLACALAHLPSTIVPHSMRHGRGQRVWGATHDLSMVQACLRHKNKETSMIYTHIENAQDGLRRLSQTSVSSNPLR